MATQGKLSKDSNNKSFKHTEEIITTINTIHSVKRIVSIEVEVPSEPPKRYPILIFLSKFFVRISAPLISLISKLIEKHF